MSTSVEPTTLPLGSEGDAFDAAIQSAVRDSLPSEEPQTPDRSLPPRDESGKFTKASDTPAPVDGAAPPAGDQAATQSKPGEEEAQAPTLPEGVVLAAPIAGRELATQFVLKDATGAELEIPDIRVSFKASGKDREAPLDEVVRLAQWGYANLERDQKYARVEQEAGTVKATLESERQHRAILEADVARMLTDQNYYLQVVEEYAAANTPEKVAERARQEAEDARQSVQMERLQFANDRFVEGEIGPAITALAASHPYVSENEVAIAVTQATQHLCDANGFLPPNMFEQARWVVVNHVLPWVREQQADRVKRLGAPPTTKPAPKAPPVDARAVESQRLKRDVARAAQPVSRGGAAPATGPRREAVTVDEHIDDAVSAALKATFPGVQSTRGAA